MKCPSIRQSLVYGTTTTIGAAAGLAILVLTARVALPLFQKLSITPQNWLTRSAFIATGGTIGLATPWVASTTYRLATTTLAPNGGKELTPIGAEEQEALEKVKQLIDAKADLNEKDRNGQTPLHSAAWEGHATVAALLGRGTLPSPHCSSKQVRT